MISMPCNTKFFLTFLCTCIISLSVFADPVTITLKDGTVWQGETGQQISLIQKKGRKKVTVEGTLSRDAGTFILVTTVLRDEVIYVRDIESIETQSVSPEESVEVAETITAELTTLDQVEKPKPKVFTGGDNKLEGIMYVYDFIRKTPPLDANNFNKLKSLEESLERQKSSNQRQLVQNAIDKLHNKWENKAPKVVLVEFGDPNSYQNLLPIEIYASRGLKKGKYYEVSIKPIDSLGDEENNIEILNARLIASKECAKPNWWDNTPSGPSAGWPGVDHLNAYIELYRAFVKNNPYLLGLTCTKTDSSVPFIVWCTSSNNKASGIEPGDKLLSISIDGTSYNLDEVFDHRATRDQIRPYAQTKGVVRIDVSRSGNTIEGILVKQEPVADHLEFLKELREKCISREWDEVISMLDSSPVLTDFNRLNLHIIIMTTKWLEHLQLQTPTELTQDAYNDSQFAYADYLIKASEHNPVLVDRSNWSFEMILNIIEFLTNAGETELAGNLLTSLIATQVNATFTGSGFFVSSDGKIITNHHVVKNAKTIKVIDAMGTEHIATVIAESASSDLALLDIGQDVPSYLTLISSATVNLGDDVFTVGYPMPGILGQSAKYSKGTISSIKSGAKDANKFQISNPIQPGNSGGPLVDENGYVVGIVVSKIQGLEVENVGFAIKSDVAVPLLSSYPETMSKSNSQSPIKDISDEEFEQWIIEHTENSACQIIVTTKPEYN